MLDYDVSLKESNAYQLRALKVCTETIQVHFFTSSLCIISSELMSVLVQVSPVSVQSSHVWM